MIVLRFGAVPQRNPLVSFSRIVQTLLSHQKKRGLMFEGWLCTAMIRWTEKSHRLGWKLVGAVQLPSIALHFFALKAVGLLSVRWQRMHSVCSIVFFFEYIHVNVQQLRYIIDVIDTYGVWHICSEVILAGLVVYGILAACAYFSGVKWLAPVLLCWPEASCCALLDMNGSRWKWEARDTIDWIYHVFGTWRMAVNL